MGSVNLVTLIGYLGRDADLRFTPGGAAVASFSMATTETWNDKAGQRQERTQWHRITLWGKQAEVLAEYLVKGKQVCILGKIEYREWVDKDGIKRYATDIRSERVVLLGGGLRQELPGNRHVSDEEMGNQMGAAPPLEDIPF